MGYEVRVIIGKIHRSEEDSAFAYFSKVAEYDLSVMELESSRIGRLRGLNLFERQQGELPIRVFWYEGEGRVEEDLYGDPLLAIDPKILLQELIERAKVDSYRRIYPLISLLSAMLRFWGEDFHVVLYGH